MKITRDESLATLASLAAVGAVCLLANWHQPLVRNGIVYARAVEHVIEHGFDPLPVVADSRLSYDKPIGFAWLASPLVALLGTHHGLMLASCLGTIAYLCATSWFASARLPFELTARERALVLLFSGLSPIVAYQFWSAHPDSLFAALYLASFVLAHAIVEAPSFRLVAWLSVTIFASLLLKNYGMILLPSCALYFAWHYKRILATPRTRIVAAAIAVAFGALATLVILGRTGHNALMRIDGEGGGAGQYGQGSWWLSCRGTWVQVGLALLVNLHVALPFAFRARGWRSRPEPAPPRTGLLAAFVCFPLVYIAGLMLFPTTFYNMRYFVPLLPFVALLAVSGLRAASTVTRRIAVPAFAAVALASIAVFDCAPLYTRVAPWIPKLEVNWIGVPLSLLDNLRLRQHIEQAAWIENLNRQVASDGVVYMLDVNYYGDAQRGVFERAGLIRRDIETRYASSRGFAPDDKHYFVQATLRDPHALDGLGAVTDRGHGLFEVKVRD